MAQIRAARSRSSAFAHPGRSTVTWYNRRPMSGDSSTAHIIQSLVINFVISVAKGVGALRPGPGPMPAETLPSLADCGTRGLLLPGVRKSRKPPTPSHPLGYGRVLYFWSFMVALLLFSGGGVFSIYESIHKLRHPEPVGDMRVAMGILVLSLVLEGWATYKHIVEPTTPRKGRPFLRFLSDSKDSDLVVVFGETAAAVLGLAVALLAICLAAWTGDGTWDAVGSLLLGVVLIGVAPFLAIGGKSPVVGGGAGPVIAPPSARTPRLFGVFLLLYFLRGLKQINQWEVGLRFTLGKLSGRIEPGVTLFLPIRSHPLIAGEAADPEIAAAVHASAAEDPRITHVLHLITVQQGPGEVIVAAKMGFQLSLTLVEIAAAINEFEARLRARCPEARWSFIEPDVPRA